MSKRWLKFAVGAASCASVSIAGVAPKRGGGGGSFDWLAVAVLSGLVVRRRRGISKRPRTVEDEELST